LVGNAKEIVNGHLATITATGLQTGSWLCFGDFKESGASRWGSGSISIRGWAVTCSRHEAFIKTERQLISHIAKSESNLVL
jgi:hypothetical protein